MGGSEVQGKASLSYTETWRQAESLVSLKLCLKMSSYVHTQPRAPGLGPQPAASKVCGTGSHSSLSGGQPDLHMATRGSPGQCQAFQPGAALLCTSFPQDRTVRLTSSGLCARANLLRLPQPGLQHFKQCSAERAKVTLYNTYLLLIWNSEIVNGTISVTSGR